MLREAQIFTCVPDGLLALLTERLPTSLSILRRLQLAARDAGSAPNARIILVSDSGGLGGRSAKPRAFTVVYANFSVSTETQMFMYSTLEDKSRGAISDDDRSEHEAQLDHVMEALIRLRTELDPESVYPSCLLLGSVHSDVRAIIEKSGRVRPRPSGDYDKWLFRVEDLPQSESPLPEGMHWRGTTLADCELVVSRTDIPRTAETLSALPSLMVKLEDETPVAWAFLGIDGSLISLHCEDGYRRRGLAKRVAAKLLRENASADGWSSADVSGENVASRAMCKSLGGKPRWVVSWLLLDLAEEVKI
ncbi:Uncharacterized protein TCAP_00476 [Tolypocladium capitatum]|uniref:N-acetyltransferase domain-containing protein n=1 Tax=Tolypocladium capitatum TaxID=45235 RepID=A0A2K3QPZ2_9HYPO|nr:Uncharacterized protein TCAP_00476 [Tolypocladium capitatum]